MFALIPFLTLGPKVCSLVKNDPQLVLNTIGSNAAARQTPGVNNSECSIRVLQHSSLVHMFCCTLEGRNAEQDAKHENGEEGQIGLRSKCPVERSHTAFSLSRHRLLHIFNCDTLTGKPRMRGDLHSSRKRPFTDRSRVVTISDTVNCLNNASASVGV